MRQLPYDMARCPATQPCPDKERCARHTSPGSPAGQNTLDVSSIRLPDYCAMFISNEVPHD